MENKLLKILYVNGGIMDRGGVSSVIMGYYLNINSDMIQVDFIVHGDRIGERDSEILQRGGRIYRVPQKSVNLIENYKQIKRIMLEGKYDIVHSHADSGNAYILKIAKKCGIKVRVSHSHNTDYTIENRIRIIYNEIQKRKIRQYATHQWACSKPAGEWLYGRKSVFEIIPNAIDTNRFSFNTTIRETIRREYMLDNRIVIGHVGRFDFQKNQKFLLNVFYEAAKKNEELSLVFIGEGKDKTILEEKVRQLGLQDKVLFLGQRGDVNCLLSIFDVFAFPSQFEGLGVAVIEAQANGLHCVVSEHVPAETNITGNVKFLPLVTSIWVEELLKTYNRDEDGKKKIIDHGYDINCVAGLIQKKYLEMVNE